jgi:excisionase family DNA binding protein
MGEIADPAPIAQLATRITVDEIASRVNLGRLAVYALLQQGAIPGIRLGRRWIITRHAYESRERTCGMRFASGFGSQPEVSVVN